MTHHQPAPTPDKWVMPPWFILVSGKPLDVTPGDTKRKTLHQILTQFASTETYKKIKQLFGCFQLRFFPMVCYTEMNIWYIK